MDERNETKLFGVGFITGAMLGLVIGILYAPKPGIEVRSEIKEKATIAEQKAEQIISEAKQKASQIIDEAKTKAASLKKKESAE